MNSSNASYMITTPSSSGSIVMGTEWTTQISSGLAMQIGLGGTVPITPDDVKANTVPAHGANVSLKLFFSFVKSKFTKLERDKIMAAMRRYQAMQLEAKVLGQLGLYEQLTTALLLAVREQQCLACGFDTMILREDALRYVSKVDVKVKLEALESFPRPIPTEPAARLKLARERNLFDAYHILYHPATDEAPAKSTARKIREKDPILFGSFAHAEGRLYVVADWIDEHCDLTVDKLVSGLKTLEKTYLPTKLRTPTPIDVEALKKEVMDRADRLRTTTPSNWRAQEAAEKATHTTKPGRVARFRAWLRKVCDVDVRG